MTTNDSSLKTPLVEADHLQTDIVNDDYVANDADAVSTASTHDTDSSETHVPAYKQAENSTVNGAAATGGVLGFLIGGPLGALVCGAWMAHMAANKNGSWADIVRECGTEASKIGQGRSATTEPSTSSTTAPAPVPAKSESPKKQRRSSNKESWGTRITRSLVRSSECVEAWVDKTFNKGQNSQQ